MCSLVFPLLSIRGSCLLGNFSSKVKNYGIAHPNQIVWLLLNTMFSVLARKEQTGREFETL